MIVLVKRLRSASAIGLLVAAMGFAGAAPPAEATGAGGSTSTGGSGVPGPPQAQTYGVGEIVVTYSDWSRRVMVHGRFVPRQLVTLIRYPTTFAESRPDALSIPPARSAGPFPLIVFAHGFNITPAPYAPLLRAWARAGYVVAAPIFPLSNAAAPGGPNEADLVNQPGDMSFVISHLIAASAARHGILSGLIARRRIAVTGQSDGGSTALAVAYNQHYVDHRIGAAMILSGAMIPGIGGYTFPTPSPPLLAVQGTADAVNAPASTYHFFRLAPQPKFLLSLLGAPHLGPYTNHQPELGVVERVTTAFLDRYLKRAPEAAARMLAAGNVRRVATLSG
jgi:dienelactone hydrolase